MTRLREDGSGDPHKGAMMAQLRLWALSEGADFCDGCEDIIWPEIELVRCDICCGKLGPPSMESIREAEKRHAKRIAEDQKERDREFAELAGRADPEGYGEPGDVGDDSATS